MSSTIRTNRGLLVTIYKRANLTIGITSDRRIHMIEQLVYPHKVLLDDLIRFLLEISVTPIDIYDYPKDCWLP